MMRAQAAGQVVNNARKKARCVRGRANRAHSRTIQLRAEAAPGVGLCAFYQQARFARIVLFLFAVRKTWGIRGGERFRVNTTTINQKN